MMLNFTAQKKQIFLLQDLSPRQSTKLQVMSDKKIFILRLDIEKGSDTTPVPFN